MEKRNPKIHSCPSCESENVFVDTVVSGKLYRVRCKDCCDYGKLTRTEIGAIRVWNKFISEDKGE